MPKLKKAVKDFLGAVPVERSGDAARLQRQRVRADAQGDRPGRAHARRRSARAVGRDRALRRDPPRHRHARPADRPQGARRVHRRRGSGQPRGDRGRRAPAAGERRDALHDRAGPRHQSGLPEEDDAAADGADRRPHVHDRQRRRSCTARSRNCSTSCRISICSAIRRPTTSATTPGARSRSRWTATAAFARGRDIARRRTNDDDHHERRSARDRGAVWFPDRVCVRCGCASLVATVAVAAQQQELPRFRSSVELTSIDVSVFDDRGPPGRGSEAGGFHRPRRRQPAPRRERRVDSARSAARAAPCTPPPDGYSANDNATGGRLILIVVDQPNIRFGGTLRDSQGRERVHRSPAAVRSRRRGRHRPRLAVTPFTADRARLKKAIEAHGRSASRHRLPPAQHRAHRGAGHHARHAWRARHGHRSRVPSASNSNAIQRRRSPDVHARSAARGSTSWPRRRAVDGQRHDRGASQRS